MWPYLPKKCNCSETPNNPQLKCEHDGLTTNDVAYMGNDLLCTGIESGDSITQVVQIFDYYMCSELFAQHFLDALSNNIEEFPTFIDLVNDAIDCDVINFCITSSTTTTLIPTTTTTSSSSTSSSTTSTTSSTSSTTSTTTTQIVQCVDYTLMAIQPNASWTATNCDEVITSGVIVLVGATSQTGCILDNTLILNGISIVNNIECTTTTSSTSTSSTTTTTTTSIPTTTTSTTTDIPITTTTTTTNSAKLIFHNNSSGGIINDIYAVGWTVATYTPVNPGNSMYGNHGNTNQPIIADIYATIEGCLSMYIEGVLIESVSINFIGTHTYSFTPVTINSTDHVIFVYNDGFC